jgi:predicted transcriptional regulator
MALRIGEVMNRELFSLRPQSDIASARAAILSMGITAAPVVDEEERPVGMISLRDLVGDKGGKTVGDRMSRPAATIGANDPIALAARIIAQTGFHHLPVVDAVGRAVGFVSALDLLRGLLGLPAEHPAAFPHVDERTGLVWSNDRPLDWSYVESAPDGPGVLMLIESRAGYPDRIVSAEAPQSLRGRLVQILGNPDRGANLLFRVAASENGEMRELALWLAQEEQA